MVGTKYLRVVILKVSERSGKRCLGLLNVSVPSGAVCAGCVNPEITKAVMLSEGLVLCNHHTMYHVERVA